MLSFKDFMSGTHAQAITMLPQEDWPSCQSCGTLQTCFRVCMILDGGTVEPCMESVVVIALISTCFQSKD